MPESFLRRALRRVSGGAGRDQSIEALASAVRQLAEAQRDQAVQLKKLVDAQKAQDHRWQEAFDRWQKDARESARRAQHGMARTDQRVQRHWQEIIESLQQGDKAQRKWRVVFVRQIAAMMRTMQLSRMALPPPHDLVAKRFRLFSQNEEDGIILALFEHAGFTDRRFVEIGSGSSGGNSALLAYECGWSGLMIDSEQRKIDSLRKSFRHNPGVVGVAAAVSPANINEILSEHGFTGEIDLVSIDIDSYDYWVLESLTVVSPRVLIVEYNARLGSDRALTMPKDGALDEVPKRLRGASLAAIEKLARRKGYRLVVCDPTGTNAFFVRDGVAPDLPAVTVADAYRPAIDRWSLEGVPEAADRASIATGSMPLVEV
jgi:hypothetical protein